MLADNRFGSVFAQKIPCVCWATIHIHVLRTYEIKLDNPLKTMIKNDREIRGNLV